MSSAMVCLAYAVHDIRLQSPKACTYTRKREHNVDCNHCTWNLGTAKYSQAMTLTQCLRNTELGKNKLFAVFNCAKCLMPEVSVAFTRCHMHRFKDIGINAIHNQNMHSCPQLLCNRAYISDETPFYQLTRSRSKTCSWNKYNVRGENYPSY